MEIIYEAAIRLSSFITIRTWTIIWNNLEKNTMGYKERDMSIPSVKKKFNQREVREKTESLESKYCEESVALERQKQDRERHRYQSWIWGRTRPEHVAYLLTEVRTRMRRKAVELTEKWWLKSHRVGNQSKAPKEFCCCFRNLRDGYRINRRDGWMVAA